MTVFIRNSYTLAKAIPFEIRFLSSSFPLIPMDDSKCYGQLIDRIRAKATKLASIHFISLICDRFNYWNFKLDSFSSSQQTVDEKCDYCSDEREHNFAYIASYSSHEPICTAHNLVRCWVCSANQNSWFAHKSLFLKLINI